VGKTRNRIRERGKDEKNGSVGRNSRDGEGKITKRGVRSRERGWTLAIEQRGFEAECTGNCAGVTGIEGVPPSLPCKNPRNISLGKPGTSFALYSVLSAAKTTSGVPL
jgi:hypothetical protein